MLSWGLGGAHGTVRRVRRPRLFDGTAQRFSAMEKPFVRYL